MILLILFNVGPRGVHAHSEAQNWQRGVAEMLSNRVSRYPSTVRTLIHHRADMKKHWKSFMGRVSL